MVSLLSTAAVMWLSAAAAPPAPSDLVTAPQSPAAIGQACGMSIPAPVRMPPSDSGPIVLALLLCFEAQGGQSLIDAQTYLYYIQVKPSEPSRDV